MAGCWVRTLVLLVLTVCVATDKSNDDDMNVTGVMDNMKLDYMKMDDMSTKRTGGGVNTVAVTFEDAFPAPWGGAEFFVSDGASFICSGVTEDGDKIPITCSAEGKLLRLEALATDIVSLLISSTADFELFPGSMGIAGADLATKLKKADSTSMPTGWRKNAAQLQESDMEVPEDKAEGDNKPEGNKAEGDMPAGGKLEEGEGKTDGSMPESVQRKKRSARKLVDNKTIMEDDMNQTRDLDDKDNMDPMDMDKKEKGGEMNDMQGGGKGGKCAVGGSCFYQALGAAFGKLEKQAASQTVNAIKKIAGFASASKGEKGEDDEEQDNDKRPEGDENKPEASQEADKSPAGDENKPDGAGPPDGDAEKPEGPPDSDDEKPEGGGPPDSDTEKPDGAGPPDGDAEKPEGPPDSDDEKPEGDGPPDSDAEKPEGDGPPGGDAEKPDGDGPPDGGPPDGDKPAPANKRVMRTLDTAGAGPTEGPMSGDGPDAMESDAKSSKKDMAKGDMKDAEDDSETDYKVVAQVLCQVWKNAKMTIKPAQADGEGEEGKGPEDGGKPSDNKDPDEGSPSKPAETSKPAEPSDTKGTGAGQVNCGAKKQEVGCQNLIKGGHPCRWNKNKSKCVKDQSKATETEK